MRGFHLCLSRAAAQFMSPLGIESLPLYLRPYVERLRELQERHPSLSVMVTNGVIEASFPSSADRAVRQSVGIVTESVGSKGGCRTVWEGSLRPGVSGFRVYFSPEAKAVSLGIEGISEVFDELRLWYSREALRYGVYESSESPLGLALKEPASETEYLKSLEFCWDMWRDLGCRESFRPNPLAFATRIGFLSERALAVVGQKIEFLSHVPVRSGVLDTLLTEVVRRGWSVRRARDQYSISFPAGISEDDRSFLKAVWELVDSQHPFILEGKDSTDLSHYIAILAPNPAGFKIHESMNTYSLTELGKPDLENKTSDDEKTEPLPGEEKGSKEAEDAPEPGGAGSEEATSPDDYKGLYDKLISSYIVSLKTNGVGVENAPSGDGFIIHLSPEQTETKYLGHLFHDLLADLGGNQDVLDAFTKGGSHESDYVYAPDFDYFKQTLKLGFSDRAYGMVPELELLLR